MTSLADLKARLLEEEAVRLAYVEVDAEFLCLEAAIYNRAVRNADGSTRVGCASAHHPKGDDEMVR